MKVAICDANVAIDLYRIGALDKFLTASFFDIHITDFVLSELKDKNLREKIEKSSVVIHEFKPYEIAEIVLIKDSCGISIQDSSCIYYATQFKEVVILSGDKKLKKQAENNYDLEVRGTIFIIRTMSQQNLINIEDAIFYLKKLKETNQRMPTAEIDKEIDYLKKTKPQCCY